MAGVVTFRIKTEQAQAVAAFLQVEQAEQKLTLEAMKASQAMKRQEIAALELGKKQGELSRAIKKVNEEQAKLIETTRLIEMQKRKLARETEQLNTKLMEHAGLTKKVAEADAHAERQKKLLVAIKKQEREKEDQLRTAYQEGIRKRDEIAERNENMAKSMGMFILGAAGMSSVEEALGRVVNLAIEADEHLAKMGERATAKGEGAKGLALLVDRTPEGRKLLKDTTLEGAKYGLKSEAAHGIMEPIYTASARMDGQEGLSEEERADAFKRFEANAKLVSIGVGEDDAMQIEKLGRDSGMEAGRVQDLVALSASRSDWSPQDYARASSELGSYSNVVEGLAAVEAFSASSEIPKEEVRTYMKAGAQVFGKGADKGPEQDFIKRFKLQGLSETDKVLKIQEYAITKGDQSLSEEERINKFTENLYNYGLEDNERRKAVAVMVKNGGMMSNARQALSTAPAGALDEMYTHLLDTPETGRYMRSEVAKAQLEANTLYGPEAEAAAKKEEEQLSRGQERAAEGQSMLVDESTGREKLSGRIERWTRGAGLLPGAFGLAAGIQHAGFNYLTGADAETSMKRAFGFAEGRETAEGWFGGGDVPQPLIDAMKHLGDVMSGAADKIAAASKGSEKDVAPAPVAVDRNANI